jgi:hypothetical protein
MKKTENREQPVEPLRLLRTLAGQLPQTELARATDISLDTIRAIENNRRALTGALFQKIKVSIGAQWDPKQQRWHLVDRPDEPYSVEWYEKFRTKWFQHFHQVAIEAHVLCRRILELLIQVEDTDYNSLFYRIFDFLDETRESLRITGARKVFDKTRFEVDFGRNIKTKEVELIVRRFMQMDDSIVPRSKTHPREHEFLNFSWLMRPEESKKEEA